MNKILLIFLILCSMVLPLSAQELTVQSFRLNATDLDARVNPVFDLNGESCALVKVAIVGNSISFEGNISRMEKHRQSEYYVYMPAGSKRLKVISQGYLPLSVEFSDYGIKLEKSQTYELRIVSPMILGTIPSIEKQFLIMDVSPSDATVLIDDIPQKLENGVLTVDLVCGKHSYSVERAMFKRVDGEFEITPEQRTEISVSLEETSGFIYVTSTPIQNAKVYIDEEYEGDTPFTSKRMSEGEHTVKVISDGYYIYTRTVNVIAGKTHEVEAELKQSFSGVYLIASQPDAEIRLDGIPLGNGSWKGRVDPGKHKVEQVKEGFVIATEVINAVKGQNVTIKLAEMNPYYGLVSVTSNPIAAQVSVDGILVGETPLRTNRITVGKHTFSAVKEGYETRTGEIVVSKDVPTEISFDLPPAIAEKRAVGNATAGKAREVEAESKQNFSVVHLVASQPDAEIRLDGKPLGNGSWEGRIDPGKHKVDQVWEGFIIASEVIDVVKGRNVTINLAEKNPHFGLVSITSNPIAAEVFVDGIFIGETPLKTNKLPVGKHLFSAVKDGYETRTGKIVVNKDVPTEISFDLPPVIAE